MLQRWEDPMVIINPESQRKFGDRILDTFGTAASIRAAIASNCDFDVARITVRMLGPYAVIEGTAAQRQHVEQITSIVADIVGEDFVKTRIFGHWN